MPNPKLCPLGRMAIHAIRRYTQAMSRLHRYENAQPTPARDDPKRLDLFWATQNTYLELLEVLKKI